MRVHSSLQDPDVAKTLIAGGVAVLPTDTVYGLVACATNQAAIDRMYNLKQRERQPGTIIAASIEQLEQLGFSRENLAIAAQHWPNAVSVVMNASSIPHYLKRDLPDLPARIPNSPALVALLEQTGPLMTTSANAPKEPTSTTVEMAQGYFGESVDFYVDGGDLSQQEASTIIGIKPSGELVIYRQGAVTIEPTS